MCGEIALIRACRRYGHRFGHPSLFGFDHKSLTSLTTKRIPFADREKLSANGSHHRNSLSPAIPD